MPTLDHVICPVDLSDCSGRALTYAASWAHWYEADLRILHVVSLPIPVAGAGGGIVMATTHAPLESVRAQVRAFVDNVARADVPTSLQILEGDPVETILDRFHLRSIWLGGVTDRVIRAAEVPVLIIPATPESSRRNDHRKEETS